MSDRLSPAVVFVTILLVLTGMGDAADQKVIFHMDELIRIALDKSPEIEASRQETEAYRSRVTQNMASYLPQVSAETGYNRLRRLYTYSGQTLPGETDLYSTGIMVSQHIHDFGVTEGRVEQSRYNLSASEKGIDKTAADTVRDVQIIYYEILKKKGFVEVGEESVRIQQVHLNQAKAFVEAGVRPKIDVTRSEVELANTRLRLLRADYALRAAFLDLENRMGGPPSIYEYDLADVPVNGFYDIKPESAVADAFHLRPELAMVKEHIQAANALLKASRGGRYPAITADAIYQWENNELPLENTWQVGLNLSWALFTGFRTTGKITEVHSEIARLQAHQKQIELQIQREVTLACQQVMESTESIKTAESALQQAKENMALADGRYQNGVGNAIEYADAELVLTQARINLIQANYEYLQNLTLLDHAAGRLKAEGAATCIQAGCLFLNTHISLLHTENIFTVNHYPKGILANG